MTKYVYLAYYHNGYTDDPPILLAVCALEVIALKVIKKHKKLRDRRFEYENEASWWTREHIIKKG